jgi:hypothetical protein
MQAATMKRSSQVLFVVFGFAAHRLPMVHVRPDKIQNVV